tara:strand:+ start:35021 stop:36034 length:1014 start_codon:yes stop_codon:yes gene_type:complete
MDAHKLSTKVKFLKVLTPARSGEFHNHLKSAGKKSLHELLVFSFMAYRSRLGAGATTRSIAISTGLSPRTVVAVLNNLGDLVIKSGREHVLNEPRPECFMPLSQHDGEHWTDGCCYTRLLLPRKGATISYQKVNRRFGLNHSCIYSLLIGLSRKNDYTLTTEAGLSTLMNGVHRKTIGAALNDLDHLGLITREKQGDRLRVTLLDVKEQHLELFRPQPEKVKITVREPQPPADPNCYVKRNDGYDQWRECCVGVMPQSTADKAIEMAVTLGDDEMEFRGVVSEIKRIDLENRESGKRSKSNPGGFLLYRYRERMNAREQALAELERSEWFQSDEFWR